MLRYIFYFLLPLCLISCSSKPDAQAIIDKTIAVHGGENYENISVQFTLRDRMYIMLRNGGKYKYSRMFKTSDSVIVDELDNNHFERSINGQLFELLEEEEIKYSSSINSVIYFALLPYALNDPAVVKEYLGETTIEGEAYYEIQVTFEEKGGGKDFEDVFVYWVHRENYTMDYLAYEYHTEGGGTRFREAVNQREINGIKFADYHNYKGAPLDSIPLWESDRLFQEGKLEKISEINLKNIKVRHLNKDVKVAEY